MPSAPLYIALLRALLEHDDSQKSKIDLFRSQCACSINCHATTRSNCRGWRLCSSYPSRGQAARLLSALLPYYVERTLHPACHVLDPDSTAY